MVVKDIEARKQIEVLKRVVQTLLDENIKRVRLENLGKALTHFPTIQISQEMPKE